MRSLTDVKRAYSLASWRQGHHAAGARYSDQHLGHGERRTIRLAPTRVRDSTGRPAGGDRQQRAVPLSEGQRKLRPKVKWCRSTAVDTAPIGFACAATIVSSVEEKLLRHNVRRSGENSTAWELPRNSGRASRRPGPIAKRTSTRGDPSIVPHSSAPSGCTATSCGPRWSASRLPGTDSSTTHRRLPRSPFCRPRTQRHADSQRRWSSTPGHAFKDTRPAGGLVTTIHVALRLAPDLVMTGCHGGVAHQAPERTRDQRQRTRCRRGNDPGVGTACRGLGDAHLSNRSMTLAVDGVALVPHPTQALDPAATATSRQGRRYALLRDAKRDGPPAPPTRSERTGRVDRHAARGRSASNVCRQSARLGPLVARRVLNPLPTRVPTRRGFRAVKSAVTVGWADSSARDRSGLREQRSNAPYREPRW